MVDLAIRIVINAIALVVAAKLIPDIHLKIGPVGVEWLKIAAIALVFALVNSYIKPIVKVLSFPITVLTLGLVSFIINAALFLLVAWVADLLFPGYGRRQTVLSMVSPAVPGATSCQASSS